MRVRIPFYNFIQRLDEASGSDIAMVLTNLYNSNDISSLSVYTSSDRKMSNLVRDSSVQLRLRSDTDPDYIVVRVTSDNNFITEMNVKNSEEVLNTYYIMKDN